MPIGGDFYELAFNKIDFPVGDTFTNIKQKFQFFVDERRVDRIPFFLEKF